MKNNLYNLGLTDIWKHDSDLGTYSSPPKFKMFQSAKQDQG